MHIYFFVFKNFQQILVQKGQIFQKIMELEFPGKPIKR